MIRHGILTLLIAFASAAAERAEPELDVIPTPKQVTSEKGYFEFDRYAAILVSDKSAPGTRVAARAVQAGLQERFGLDVPILRIVDERKYGPRKSIWVVEPRLLHPPDKTIGVQGLKFTDDMAAEGYYLRVDAIAIVVHGASDAGSYWGAQTLLQLIRPPRKGGLFGRGRGPTVPCLWMADWPSNRDRVVPPEMKVPADPAAAEQFIKDAARYKLNGIARGAVPDNEATRERLRAASERYPVPWMEKFKPFGLGHPLVAAGLAAAAEGRTRYALAALAEVAWGPPDPDPEPFRQRFLREAGEQEPVPKRPRRGGEQPRP